LVRKPAIASPVRKMLSGDPVASPLWSIARLGPAIFIPSPAWLVVVPGSQVEYSSPDPVGFSTVTNELPEGVGCKAFGVVARSEPAVPVT
jgi:hypothetical protein